MNLGLDGKVVLVTGAGSGIGQAIAAAFGGEGAHVAINDLDLDGIERTLALLPDRAAGLSAPFDVGSLDDARRGIQSVIDAFGRIDVLVNNAALMAGNARFIDTRPEDNEREIRVALFGTLNCTRGVLPGMIARGDGRIVNVVSDAARVGQEREAVYSSAKGAVMAFTRSIAREVGPQGITVNAVSPAATDTAMRRQMLARMAAERGEAHVAAREERVRKAYPMRRIGAPADTASMVLFLASRQATWVTGQVISVNGGFSM